jgi:hypothetical protein
MKARWAPAGSTTGRARIDRSAACCEQRILTAIDAKTGNDRGFGDNGKLDVRVGLHRDVNSLRRCKRGTQANRN